MKTTENISLAGYAFVIETDACSELESYLNDIKSSFSGDDSADEIVADIEARVAELLKEKCISGMVVNIGMVRDVKKTIGNPSELSEDEPSVDNGPGGETPKPEKKTQRRRLYRNMDEKVLGGVCSGLGTYFGIDKVLFRIIFLMLLFIGFIGLDDGPFVLFSMLVYIGLWIAMPAARTDEQKREMRGKPVNLSNYKDSSFNLRAEAREAADSPAGRTFRRAGGIFLGLLLLITGLGGLLGCLFIPSVPTIIGNEAVEHIQYFGELDPDEQFGLDLTTSTTFWGLILVMLGLFCIWSIYNGIMLLFDLKSPSWRPGLILFLAWLLSLFVLIAWIIREVAEALPILVA